MDVICLSLICWKLLTVLIGEARSMGGRVSYADRAAAARLSGISAIGYVS